MLTSVSKFLSVNKLLTFIMFSGVGLRLIRYFWNSGLYHDEVLLALNIARRSTMGLLEPLDYGQVAPPLFLLAANAVTALLGHGEWALRLFPVFCSCVAMIWFVQFSKRYLHPLVAIVGSSILAFSPILVLYAVNFKPYASDVLISVVLLHIYSKTAYSRVTLILCGFALLLAPWMSFPSVFVVAGLGVGFFCYHMSLKQWREAGLVAALSFVAFISFCALHFTIIRNTASSELLASFWEPYYMVSPYFSVHNLNVFFNGVRQSAGLLPHGNNFLIVFSILFVVSMIVGLWRHSRQALPCVTVLMVTALASGLSLYPFAERLLIFMSPMVGILFGHLFAEIDAKGRSCNWVALSLFLIFIGIHWSWNLASVFSPPSQQQAREALRYVFDHRKPVEPVFTVSPGGVFCEYPMLAFSEYYRMQGLEVPCQVIENLEHSTVIEKVKGEAAFWVVSEERIQEQIDHLEGFLSSISRASATGEMDTYVLDYFPFKGAMVLHLRVNGVDD
ncbi:MAG TPA: hypothetical protein DCX06_04975 [Opitutae bacterium]|nr:hypothetical protein [Opitutae bacterium]